MNQYRTHTPLYLLAIVFALSSPVYAADFTVTGLDNVSKTLDANETGTVTVTGDLDTAGTAVNINGDSATLTNDGTIDGGIDGVSVSGTGTNATIVNNGTIIGAEDGIDSSADGASITNNGTIDNTAGTGDGIKAGTGDNVVIINNGDVNAHDDGIASGR